MLGLYSFHAHIPRNLRNIIKSLQRCANVMKLQVVAQTCIVYIHTTKETHLARIGVWGDAAQVFDPAPVPVVSFHLCEAKSRSLILKEVE